MKKNYNLLISNDKILIDKRLINLPIGNWIQIFSQKNEKNTLRYHWDNKKKLQKDIVYIKKIYDYFLNLFSSSLNSYFKKNYNKRYWEIILGYWLNLFICFYFDRWEQVGSIKNNKNISVNTFNFKKKLFIPENTVNFSIIHSNNDWNHWVLSEILNHKGFAIRIRKNKKPKIPKIFFPRKVSKFFHFYNDIFKKKILKKKLLLYDLDLSRTFKLKVDLYFDKFSTIFFFKDHNDNVINIKSRQTFFKKFKGKDKFSNFLSKQLIYNFPKSFFENYESINLSVNNSIVPQYPKTIITSTSHLMNDPFKFYTASKVNNKTKLIIFQHGGSYHTQGYKITDKIEYKICDKFLTWGWNEKNNKKLVPMFNPKHTTYLKRKNKNSKGILIPINNFVSFPGYVHGLPRHHDDTIKYFDKVNFFLKNLRSEIVGFSSIKMNNTEENNDMEAIIFDKFYSSNKNKIDFFRSHRTTSFYCRNYNLVVEFSNTTGFLEMINLNFPTILVLDRQVEKITDKTLNLYLMLKEANVVFFNVKDASSFINKNYHDLNKWWFSKKTQSKLNIFRKLLSHKEPRPFNKFVKFLEKYA